MFRIPGFSRQNHCESWRLRSTAQEGSPKSRLCYILISGEKQLMKSKMLENHLFHRERSLQRTQPFPSRHPCLMGGVGTRWRPAGSDGQLTPLNLTQSLLNQRLLTKQSDTIRQVTTGRSASLTAGHTWSLSCCQPPQTPA